MSGKFGFFPYEAMDYKAAQEYLDRRSAAGWVLKKIYLGFFAVFEPAQGRNHFVDLDLRSFGDTEPDPDYVQLCEDAGWEGIQALRGMLLFRSQPGRHPAPIQTDTHLEWDRFWKKYVLKNFFISAVFLVGLLPLMLFLCINSLPTFSQLLLSNSILLFLPLLFFCILCTLWQGVHALFYFLRCRRTGTVEPPGRLTDLRASFPLLITLLLLCVWFLSIAETLGLGKTVDLDYSSYNEVYTATPELSHTYPVVMARDLGLPDSTNSRHLNGRRSFLVSSFDYSELTRDSDGTHYILTTERYDCLNEDLAAWLLSQRYKETLRGDFLWGELLWEPCPLPGCDESYAVRGGSYLLFRRGRTVALVGCDDLDLTQPERFAVIETRLALS